MIASFIENQLSKNGVTRQWDKKKAWKKLRPTFTKFLRTLTPIILIAAEKIDLTKLTAEALTIVEDKSYWQQPLANGNYTIPHKRSIFRQSNRIIPLSGINLAYKEKSPTIILEFMEQFYRCILINYCEKSVRQNSAKILISELLEILKQPDNFKSSQPQFKGTGLSLAWGDKQLFNIDLPNKKLLLGLAKSSPRKTWWMPFKIHDPDNRLHSFHPREWTGLNPTIQFKNNKYYLIIPFEKQITPKRAKAIKVPKTNKKVKELVVGYDQGLKNGLLSQ